MGNTQTIIKKIKSIFSSLRITNKKRLLIIFIAVFAICVLATGSVLSYSIKLKSDGDKEYKSKNYTSSLLKYKDAQQWWLPERVSFKLRDRDLHNKINKAEIMIESGDNYIKGMDAFNNKKYPEAENYLSNLVINDPHYEEAQKLLIIIQKESLQKTVPITTNVKSIPISNNQEEENNSVINSNNNPTEIDWNEFEKNLNEKLKGIGANNSQVGQPTAVTTPMPALTPTPTSTPRPTPTPSYNDLHCPKIVKIEDNLGNISTTFNLKGAFKKGSVNLLTLKVFIIDPNNLPLRYMFSHTSNINSKYPTFGKWATDNTYSIDVVDPSIGANRYVIVYVDNQDGYNCSVGGDLVLEFDYDITP